jgi:hypothetical protein
MLITPAAACKRFKISQSYFHKLYTENPEKLPVFKYNGRIKIDEEDLKNFFKKFKRNRKK